MQFINDNNHAADAPYMAGGQSIERIIHAKGGKFIIRFYGARNTSDFAPRILKAIRNRIAEGIWDGLYGHKPTGLPFRWAIIGAPAEIAAQIRYERFDPEFSEMMQAKVDELLASIAAEEHTN